jgi:hypothetical protein
MRCYQRKTRTPIDLAKAPLGSAEFFAECARASALATVLEPKPGTLGMLITAYRDHAVFRDPVRLPSRIRLFEDIRRQKGLPDANRPWADEERDAVLARSTGPHQAGDLPVTEVRARKHEDIEPGEHHEPDRHVARKDR